MDEQIKKYIEDSNKAQDLSAKILENGRTGAPIIIEQDGEKIELIQIGSQDLMNNDINKIEDEIKTWEFLASGLDQDHQQNVKIEILGKVENLKIILKNL